MRSGHLLTRSSVCTIARGLYIFRYVSAKGESAPFVSLRNSSGSIEFIGAPGRQDAELRRAGECLVIKAETESVVEVILRASVPGLEPEAGFALDLIDRGEDHVTKNGPPVTGARAEVSPRREAEPDTSLRIAAHVSRLGDVEAKSNDWIAGPQFPLPIEGLSISTATDGLDVEVQVLTSRSAGQWSGWIGGGQFAGTRQRADPLLGLRLRLVGGFADQHVIAAEALFLGSAAVKRVGRNVEFSSTDAMVGLKLDLVRSPANVDERADLRSRQIRVFRAES